MLKTRLVGLVMVKSGIAVQSYGFSRYLPIGKPEVVVEYLDRWGIDEIALIDIDASQQSRAPNAAMIQRCAKFCHVPLSVGGGVKSLSHMEVLMRAGADKIIINSALITHPNLITEGARVFGNQSMIASIDVQRGPASQFFVKTPSLEQSSSFDSTLAINVLAQKVQARGAGEILLNSVNQDGQRRGYNLEALAEIQKAITIPVIICGGVGNATHFIDGAKLGASAVAAGNYFHFTEHSVILAKRKIMQSGIPMRLESHASYSHATLDKRDRLININEQALSKMRFTKIKEDVI